MEVHPAEKESRYNVFVFNVKETQIAMAHFCHCQETCNDCLIGIETCHAVNNLVKNVVR